MTPSLTSLAVVAAAGFAAPLAIELLRRLSLPYVVAEIGLGILVGGRETSASALLQATSIGSLVVATEIGRDMNLVSSGNAAAVVAAGLLSVLLFPLAALALLRERDQPETAPALAK